MDIEGRHRKVHRTSEAGYRVHLLNRTSARRRIVAGDGDYAASETVLAEAVGRTQTRLLDYCPMPSLGGQLARAAPA
jgi:hypothetical protein